MKKEQVAVILYTLRDFVQTEDGLARALEKVRAIGYEAVQVSGIGKDGPDAAFIRQACDLHGLAVAATHEPGQDLFTDPARVADRLEELGTIYTAYPFPKDVDLGDAAVVDRWLGQLEEATQALRERGKVLAYHNHAHEFSRLGGQLLYERIFRETSIDAELDTYWVQAGGASVERWVKWLADKGRLPLLHLKDYQIHLPNTPRFAPVGAGNIDFKPIAAAAEAGGCQYFIVEQDECWGRDPFSCIAQSFAYLERELMEKA